jgi:hypothetical protein
MRYDSIFLQRLVTVKGAEMSTIVGIFFKISEFFDKNKWAVLLIGLVIGVVLGLAYAWYLAPVEWTNATPSRLRSDFRQNYLLWVARNFVAESMTNPEWARHQLLGEDYSSDARKQTIQDDINDATQALNELAQKCQNAEETACTAEDATRLSNLAADLGTIEVAAGGGGGSLLRSLGLVCLVLIVVVALLLGALFLYARLRGRRAKTEEESDAMAERIRPIEGVAWGPDGPPLAQFPTTYTVGDDHYDPSFSIELDSGEFMGECGVGISEAIGVGAPSKVTAFEVWLFDKSDIRTVTKVLMSEYAYGDEALRAKLAPKGEPVLAEEGQEVVLETKTLRVRARIVEAKYGIGNLPPNSFFDRLTIDLISWVKVVPGGDELMAEEVDDILSPL